MNSQATEDRAKIRKEKTKQAIALAMQSRWEEAIAINRSILEVFPQELEACNRLGKALSELGHNREAKTAFQSALEISPHNSIAKKNLERLMRLGDETPRAGVRSNTAPQVFIEDSVTSGVTTLLNLSSPDVLLKLAPGHPVQLEMGGNGLTITEPSGEYVGQVEPRLASRLGKLIKGGNTYTAAVRSVAENELTVMIREVYKDPSQADIVSFPSRGDTGTRVYLQSTILAYEADEAEPAGTEPTTVKDWSDDDTEPGDDDAYTPVLHRIINPGDGAAGEEQEDEEF